MDALQSLVDGFIDFEGQRLAELLTTAILMLAGITAWIAGYITQDLKYTVYIGLSGTALAFLAIVPPWPLFNKDPLTFLPVVDVDIVQQDEGEVGQENKKAN